MYVPDGSDVSSFIEEFFHEDRKLQDTSMALVSATDLHDSTKALLVKPQYGLRVEVMRGELNVRHVTGVTRVKYRPLTPWHYF
jgi:hypothetical protein